MLLELEIYPDSLSEPYFTFHGSFLVFLLVANFIAVLLSSALCFTLSMP
jgi:hypothetical protein